MSDKLSGMERFVLAHRDEGYWQRLSEVYRTENTAMKDAIGLVSNLWRELEKDGSVESARSVFLNNRLDPLLLAIAHMESVAKK